MKRNAFLQWRFARFSHVESFMTATLDLSRFDPFDPGEPYQLLYREAIEATQTGQNDNLSKQMRFFMLYQTARDACRMAPDLDFVECGCFRGHSTYMIARILQQNRFQGEMHVFDSFEGLSAFTAADESETFSTDEQKAAVRKHFAADRQEVMQLLAPFGFVRFYPGWIPERFHEVAERRIVFLSLDVDLYEPTRDSLEFFFPRLAEGGAVFLDDYGFYRTFPGARKAIDEYLLKAPHRHLLRMPFGSALIIK
jgi:O-methyltransferase